MTQSTYHGTNREDSKESSTFSSSRDITNDARTYITPKNEPETSQLEATNDYIPIAMVLAEPAACKQRRSMRSQKSEVGTKASPIHDSDKISRHAAEIGRRPTWSETGPHSMGAIILSELDPRQMAGNVYLPTPCRTMYIVS